MPPAIGKVIRMVDEERLAVAKAYGLELDNFCTVLYNAGSTTKEAAEANCGDIEERVAAIVSTYHPQRESE